MIEPREQRHVYAKKELQTPLTNGVRPEIAMSLPATSTVTFLFTDIEGSAKLWERQPEAMRSALARHDTLLRQAIEGSGGSVFKTVGDAFCAAFPTASQAVMAALRGQTVLTAERWQTETPLSVRMALHTGQAAERDGDYFGPSLNRVARLLAIAHGGQTLLSQAAHQRCEADLPTDVTLRDMAAHRLKDLAQPEHVWQMCHPLLPADFPPLRSLQAFANNLPLQINSFVGRQAEMAQVRELLSSHRLLTLTGAGGTGKTRLSLQVAAELLEKYGDGVFLVELAALSGASLVPQAVAGALGVREEPGRSMTETLMEYLRSKSLLLLLDNCEHLIAACASLADTLLRSCARLQVLATSREALGVMGEKTWRVPPLAVPTAGDLPLGEKEVASVLLDYDGPHLFVERARLQRGDFVLDRGNVEAVAQVCARLDGIPLAIELAAARVRSLSVPEIVARLDKRFRLLTGGSRTALPRQQTLRALIDWSYDLLTGPEQTLWRRLSVFAGGWTLEAAESVCAGEGIEEWEVLEFLMSLVDKSLVSADTEENSTRYRLLETIRQYGSDRLAEEGSEGVLQERHAAWFLALAEEADPLLVGPSQAEWLSRLETEHDNLRTALAWYVEQRGTGEAGLRLVGSLGRFWKARGHLSEGRQWLGRALERDRGMELVESMASPAKARALNASGILAFDQGEYALAGTFHEESLALRRQLEDQTGIAGSLNNLGNVAYCQGDYRSAQALMAESLMLYRQIGDWKGMADSLTNLGNVSYAQANHAAARASYEESLALYRQIKNQNGVGFSLNNLGSVAFCQGDYAQARSLYEESLTLQRQLMNPQGIVIALSNLGSVASAQSEFSLAHALLAQSLTLKRQMGDPFGITSGLEAIAEAAQGRNQSRRATQVLGAADALREAIGAPLSVLERGERDKLLNSARAALDDNGFAQAWAAGQAMTMDAAIDYALAEE